MSENWFIRDPMPESRASKKLRPAPEGASTSPLPAGWLWVKMDAVVQSMKNGIYRPASSYSHDGIACLRMYNIHQGNIVWRDIKRMNLSEAEISEYELLPGDLLVNRVNSRELVGKTAEIPVGLERCVFESKNIRVRLWKEAVVPAFVNYRFLLTGSEYFSRNAQQVVGMASVNQLQVARFPFPLAPIQEQKRIVAKLNAMLARVAKGEDAARRALKRLDRYRSAVLYAAVSGELTREWRKTHPAEETGAQLLERILTERRARWEEVELQRIQTTGKMFRDDRWKRRYPQPAAPKPVNDTNLPKEWARASFDQATLNFDAQRVPLKASDRRQRAGPYPYYGASGIIDHIDTYLFDGDYLLVAEDGANLLSRCTPIASVVSGKFWVNNHAHVAQAVLCPMQFLAVYLNATDLKFFVTGTAQPKLNQANLNRIPIPLPPLSEQLAIIDLVDQRFAAADRLAATIEHQLARANSTRQSILKEAFSGTIVAQNESDEPASELLKRILTARQAEDAKPKAKRMRKAKYLVQRRPLLEVLKEQKKPVTPEMLFRAAGFQESEAALFYRELAVLRKLIVERKPSGAEGRTWPNRAKVFLELKKN